MAVTQTPSKHAGLLGTQGKRYRKPLGKAASDPLRTLQNELSRIVKLGVTQPPKTFREFLESSFILPDGPAAGKPFRIHRQPVVGLWVDAIDSGQWTEFVFTACSQFGKTLIAFVGPILWHTCELDDHTVMGVPHGDMANDKWKQDLQPILRSSVNLDRFQPVSGSGSAGGKVRDSITLSHGIVIKPMSAGAADQGKAGFTSRVIVVTEAAGFSESSATSTEADPMRQLRARQRAFREHDRRTYIEGTLTVEDDLPWNLREHSTQSRIMSQCPHCEVWVAPEREDLVGWQDASTEAEARRLAYWQCPECLEALTEQQRAEMLKHSKLLHKGQSIATDGTITGPLPETTRLWFHAKAFHNLFLEAGDIGKDEWLCRQIPEDTPERFSSEKQLAQFVHAQPYVSPLFASELELDRRVIEGRRAELPERILPADTDLLTMGADIGQKECWYLFLARRRDPIYGHHYYHIPLYGKVDVPSDRMPLEQAIKFAVKEIHRLARAGIAMAGSSIVRRPDQEWFDARHKGDAVLQAIAEINDHEFKSLSVSQRKYQPVVGAYGCGVTMINSARFNLPKKTGNEVRDIDPQGLWYCSRIARNKTYAVFWDSDTSKQQFQKALTLRDFLSTEEEQTPGSLTLYAGTARIHERLTRHWTNETLKRDAVTGKVKWQRTGANHLLDCAAMAWRAMDRAEHCGERLGVYVPPTAFAKQPTADGSRFVAAADATETAPKPTKASTGKGGSWYDR